MKILVTSLFLYKKKKHLQEKGHFEPNQVRQVLALLQKWQLDGNTSSVSDFLDELLDRIGHTIESRPCPRYGGGGGEEEEEEEERAMIELSFLAQTAQFGIQQGGRNDLQLIPVFLYCLF